MLLKTKFWALYALAFILAVLCQGLDWTLTRLDRKLGEMSDVLENRHR